MTLRGTSEAGIRLVLPDSARARRPAVPSLRLVAASALLLGGLSACVPGPEAGSEERESGGSNSSSAPGSDGSESSSEPATDLEDATDNGVVVDPETATPQDQSAAAGAAEALMRDFARPDLDADSWLAALTPRLSPTGLEAYLGTDPSLIPTRAVTGPGVVQPGSTILTAIVRVPTDAGSYDVSLSRPDAAAAWLGDRIRPVEG